MKKRSYKKGEIVRHEHHFGHVLSTHSGITVRFPDAYDSACHKTVNFHPDGSLLGGGKIVLHHADTPSTLDEQCREMSKRIQDVNRRMAKGKRNSKSVYDPETGDIATYEEDQEDEDDF